MSREKTQRIPRDVLARLVELSRPRAPATIRRELPAAPDDFDDEKTPSVLVTLLDTGLTITFTTPQTRVA